MGEQNTDRRVRKTRAQLRQALTALLREKSVRDVTVKELTELADVSRGTFYCHYKDIYDMADQVENELLEEFSAVLNAYDTSRLRGGLRPILRDIFGFLERNLDLCSTFLQAGRHTAFLDRLKALVYEKIMEEWAGLYDFKDERSRDHCISFLVGGVIGLVQTWATGARRERVEEMAALAENLILYGIKPMEREVGE